MHSLISKKEILKVSLDNSNQILTEDVLAIEKTLSIIVNNKNFHLSFSPSYLKELIIGFLISQNILNDFYLLKNINILENNNEIIAKIELKEKNNLTGVNHSLTDNSKSGNLKIESKKLLYLFKKFQQNAKLFKLTGAFHSAALAHKNQIIFFVEDISRTNVIDKVIGYAFLNKIPLYNKFLLVSCRISSQIILRIIKVGIPVIVSKSAPTSLAVKLAEKANITIIGFLRNKKFNVYSSAFRILT